MFKPRWKKVSAFLQQRTDDDCTTVTCRHIHLQKKYCCMDVPPLLPHTSIVRLMSQYVVTPHTDCRMAQAYSLAKNIVVSTTRSTNSLVLRVGPESECGEWWTTFKDTTSTITFEIKSMDAFWTWKRIAGLLES